jgi:predicted TIM-barrel fold metal-dependent hydrolase
MEHKYISADNHMSPLWFPRDIWKKRISVRFADRAPRVVETPDGTIWQCDGKRVGRSADGKDNAKHLKRYAKKGLPLPEGSLPSSDPKILLEHMDGDKVWAGVFYGDTRKWKIEDQELWLEVNRVHNDYVLELSSCAPERIIGLPNLPSRVPEACVSELYRVAAMGARAVEFSVPDAAEPMYSDAWEPLWSAAEETGLPLCCHNGDKWGTPNPPNERGASRAHHSQSPLSAGRGIAQIVFSGTLERHPRLRICFGECRIGWVPFLINWMDRQVHERPPDPTVHLKMLPSEYIKRQVRFTFEEDFVGARLLREPWSCLQETAMWGADYPHNQGVWPNPEGVLEELLDGLDLVVKRNVVFDRAVEFFRLQTPVAENAAA